MGKIMEIAEVIYKFVALNFLWLLFFILGLGIFGFMPATVALFSIIRDWLKGEKDIPLFSSYLKYFKLEFIRSNIVGLPFLVIFYVIYVNFSFVSYYYSDGVQLYIYIVLSAVAIVVLMTFVNLFSVMAHYEFKGLQYIKVAVGLVFYNPFKTLMQVIWIMAYLLIAIFLPKLFIVIGVSVFAYILMGMNYTFFQRFNAA
ncbi:MULTISPECIES: YesL family protein [Bacillaceae]|uniref:DUF624 domain-containing protein n=1 Tax=Evansella alkalicola TaxID=745819 RepID=A0ABS6JZ62_9BACI|nr:MULTISPECIES: DUF624 domain-containing protein [Bacillaceae]MBU9722969.1 DUF624 domain-containing protein [Bacillus alkalicola]